VDIGLSYLPYSLFPNFSVFIPDVSAGPMFRVMEGERTRWIIDGLAGDMAVLMSASETGPQFNRLMLDSGNDASKTLSMVDARRRSGIANWISHKGQLQYELQLDEASGVQAIIDIIYRNMLQSELDWESRNILSSLANSQSGPHAVR
jgi:hypothetical protein